MKMLKKMAALLLAGVMAMALLTACGGEAAATPSLGAQFEDAFIKGINSSRGSVYTNDSTMRAKAAAALDKINADGKIKAVDGIAVTVTPGEENKMGTIVSMIAVEKPDKVEGLTGDTLVDAIKITEADLAELKNSKGPDISDLSDLFDKTYGMEVQLKSIGVATKTMANGDTYMAYAACFTVDIPQ